MKILAQISTIFFITLLFVWGAIALWPQPKYIPYEPSEKFISQAQDFYVAPMPEGWMFYDFHAHDGRRLRWGETANLDTAKASVILVPGFGSFAEIYGEQIGMLQARGYHVIVFEARGMGGGERDDPKQPEQMRPKDFKTYSDDFAEFYTSEIRPLAKLANKPVLVMGSSFGAHLSVRSVAEHDLDINGYIGLAPAFLVYGGGFTVKQTDMLLHLFKFFGRGEYYAPSQTNWIPYSEDLTNKDADCGSYPERLYRRDVLLWKHPELRTGGATIDWLYQMMRSRKNFINTDKFLDHFHVPTTLILADQDTFVGNDYAINGCNQIESCDYDILENSRHCLLFERDQVLKQIFDATDALYERVK